MLTLRRVLAAWTILSAVGWFVLGGMAAEQEEDCRASGNFFCTADPGSVFLFVGFWVVAAWFIGTVVIVYVWSLAVGLKKRWWLLPASYTAMSEPEPISAESASLHRAKPASADELLTNQLF